MGKLKKDPPDPEGVEDVMREEKSRGRRPVDTDILRGRQRRLQDLRKWLRRDRAEDFAEAIRDLGIEPDSQEYQDALRIYEEYHKF
jgi:hypothetical protein